MVLASAALTACGSPPDERLKIARDVALTRMRDPASAEFRNERIRTLWSDQGDRKVVYCAEINGNNAFGGKTGFQPFSYQFEALEKGVRVKDWYDGQAVFAEPSSTNWYAECVRDDTQRTSADFRGRFPEFENDADDAKAYVDSHLPVISLNPAPD